MADRRLIDPNDQFPADGLRHVEQRAIAVITALRQLPYKWEMSRTRDLFQFDIGDKEGLTLFVTAESLEFRTPRIEWTCGTYGPALSSQFSRRQPWEAIAEEDLASMIEAAIQEHLSNLPSCPHCGERIHDGRGTTIDDRVLCHGCATQHYGIIY